MPFVQNIVNKYFKIYSTCTEDAHIYRLVIKPKWHSIYVYLHEIIYAYLQCPQILCISYSQELFKTLFQYRQNIEITCIHVFSVGDMCRNCIHNHMTEVYGQ